MCKCTGLAAPARLSSVYSSTLQTRRAIASQSGFLEYNSAWFAAAMFFVASAIVSSREKGFGRSNTGAPCLLLVDVVTPRNAACRARHLANKAMMNARGMRIQTAGSVRFFLCFTCRSSYTVLCFVGKSTLKDSILCRVYRTLIDVIIISACDIEEVFTNLAKSVVLISNSSGRVRGRAQTLEKKNVTTGRLWPAVI